MADQNKAGLPDVLFDGKAVYDEVCSARNNLSLYVSTNAVADVLDAVVRLMRRTPERPAQEQSENCRLRLCCRDDTHADGCTTYNRDPNEPKRGENWEATSERDEPTDREQLIACLGDDAATLIAQNPDDEMAQTMLDAAAMLEATSEQMGGAQVVSEREVIALAKQAGFTFSRPMSNPDRIELMAGNADAHDWLLRFAELIAKRAAPATGAQGATDAVDQEMKRLHDALCFWLPQSHGCLPDAMQERIAADAYLLVGYDDMPDKKSAEELGWIATNRAAAPADLYGAISSVLLSGTKLRGHTIGAVSTQLISVFNKFAKPPAAEGEATSERKPLTDGARLDFIQAHPEMTLRCYKRRWSFMGFTNYDCDVFKTPREAIDAVIEKHHGIGSDK